MSLFWKIVRTMIRKKSNNEMRQFFDLLFSERQVEEGKHLKDMRQDGWTH